MRLGIMQPYFFPYIGYFDLIYRTDHWVVFDTAQYIRHGWINRNRILHPNEGWLYIIVPTKHHKRETPIDQIRIREDGRWRDTILGQLTHYTNKAPHFDAVFDLVSSCLNDSYGSLAQLNVTSLVRVCDYLDIPFRHWLFSEMNLELGAIEAPGDWALRIAESIGANEYINPPGGADLFDRSEFQAAGVKLTIQEPVNFVYDCDGYYYQPNLSIVDVLMWNSPEAVRAYLASRSQSQKESE